MLEKIKTPEERWEDGIDHNPLSEEIYKAIADLDWDNGDTFCFKRGGDGDNGEELMYLLDMFFETKQGKEFNKK